MQVRVFTLCDGAYNYNGKLTIVGTTDNIKVQRTPASVSIGIAVKISFAPNEYGVKNIKVTITDNDGVEVLPALNLPPTEARSKGGEEARIVLAGNLQGLNFTHEGDYKVTLYVDDAEYFLPFKVVK